MGSWRDQLFGLSALIIYAGAGLILWGAFQPWRAIGFHPPHGFEDVHGKITFGIGAVTLALPSLRVLDGGVATRLLVALFGCLLGGVATAIGLQEIVDIRETSDIGFMPPPDVGIGLYMTVVGGALVFIGSLASALVPASARPPVAT
jgi:hypothetical protein